MYLLFTPMEGTAQLISINPLTNKIAKCFTCFRMASMQGTYLNTNAYRQIDQTNKKQNHLCKENWIIIYTYTEFRIIAWFPLAPALPELLGLECAEGSRNGDPKATNQPQENMKSLRVFQGIRLPIINACPIII